MHLLSHTATLTPIHAHPRTLSRTLFVWLRSYGHFTSPTPSMSPRGIFNKTHSSLHAHPRTPTHPLCQRPLSAPLFHHNAVEILSQPRSGKTHASGDCGRLLHRPCNTGRGLCRGFWCERYAFCPHTSSAGWGLEDGLAGGGGVLLLGLAVTGSEGADGFQPCAP